MRIAIVGAGFAGLATAVALLEREKRIEITLIDQKGIGGGASGIAAGLMHGFHGLEARRSPRAAEAMASARHLIALSSAESGVELIRSRGILRLPRSERQRENFAECASQNPEVEWVSTARCAHLTDGIIEREGIWIEEGLAIDCMNYLKGLWLHCERRGVELQIDRIADPEEIDADLIVLTAGVGALNWRYSEALRLRKTRGHLLLRSWPTSLPPLPCSISSGLYLTPQSDRALWIGGSYERGELSALPDVERASSELLPKAIELISQLAESETLQCAVGFRVSTPNHLPLIAQLNPRQWIFTGLGSRGLLYHALYAAELAEQLLG